MSAAVEDWVGYKLDAGPGDVEAEHPVQGRFRQVGAVLAGSTAPRAPVSLRAAGHTDTETLLREAGYSAPELAALRSQGVIA